MESRNRLHQAVHTFRQSARGSFLFPNWLTKTTDDSFDFLCLIKLKWFYYRFLTFSTPFALSQEAYLQCLILENRLNHLSHSQEQWQKNIIHRETQEQLDYFEKLLHIYFNKLKKKNDRLHTFPEIILVMAQTLEEAESSAYLQETATKLIACYENLRSFLQNQTKSWKIHKVELRENDPIIDLLLRFKNAWDAFRESRSLQVKKSNDQYPILDEIVGRLDPPHETST